ncbi:hypothetical protein [Acetobacterium bakii]|uniref:hypothetical protein n=1 Tax=Acetobacterium bakii TaxID=52689 RepID=UPI001364B9EC|nr:hypothetical protein [Acetobacterium bakii]
MGDRIPDEMIILALVVLTGSAEKADKTAVEIHYQLNDPVREDIYEYLCDVPD